MIQALLGRTVRGMESWQCMHPVLTDFTRRLSLAIWDAIVLVQVVEIGNSSVMECVQSVSTKRKIIGSGSLFSFYPNIHTFRWAVFSSMGDPKTFTEGKRGARRRFASVGATLSVFGRATKEREKQRV